MWLWAQLPITDSWVLVLLCLWPESLGAAARSSTWECMSAHVCAPCMQDPTRLPQQPNLQFLDDVKAAAVAAVAAARAVPRPRLTGETGKEATLPPRVQLQRSAGREEEQAPGAHGVRAPCLRALLTERCAHPHVPQRTSMWCRGPCYIV